MPRDDRLHYPPINTLKPVAEDVWIVDGPVIRAGVWVLKFPFSTRMTLLRLPGGDLLVHSPTPLTPDLRAAVEALGTPRWIIGPNRIHYWWIPQWRAAYPDAQVYLAPRIQAQSKGRIDFTGLPLEAEQGYPWDAHVATLPIPGSFMTEVEFFHRASRTLILTDFIENFEAQKLPSWGVRWLARLGGVVAPEGLMPRDARLTFRKQRSRLRAAVAQMIAWNPERIIVAHGRWYPRDGAAELRRAFRWVLA